MQGQRAAECLCQESRGGQLEEGRTREAPDDGVLCHKDHQMEERLELFHMPKGRNRNMDSKDFCSTFGRAFKKFELCQKME